MTWEQRIDSKDATVGVVGLGYVGLPLVETFLRGGFQVVGIDIDAKKIDLIVSGKSPIQHISGETIVPHVKDGSFIPTTDFTKANECDALILCVPTPLSDNREPDLTYVENTARQLAPHMKSGQLIVLESTTYPGTTTGVLAPLLERESGLKAGQDLFLAYSPEREDPGNAKYSTQSIPKVVGGMTQTCRSMAVALYSAVLERVIPVSSNEVAEMTKLFENIFRGVNIALVNEMKVLCHRMGLDVWEVIEAAATKPFGFMPFYPGPGLGGHCIPIDPFYLTWKAREFDMNTRFIELAGEVNTRMPEYVIQRTMEALNQHGKALKNADVLVLGIAYKRDVDDMRESPALRIIHLLKQHGARVSYHDPYIPEPVRTRRYPLEDKSVPLDEKTVSDADAVLVITDHTSIDYEFVADNAKLLIDTRNVTKTLREGRNNIVTA